MRDKKLTERDYDEIFTFAHNKYISEASRGSNHFHVRCIVDAFIIFTKKYSLMVKDGQLVEIENVKEQK
jgi:hypothetical protein